MPPWTWEPTAFQRFTRIWFPLSIPGIISGITMVFVPSLTTFVISDLLGGSKILLIGNVIEQEFTRAATGIWEADFHWSSWSLSYQYAMIPIR